MGTLISHHMLLLEKLDSQLVLPSSQLKIWLAFWDNVQDMFVHSVVLVCCLPVSVMAGQCFNYPSLQNKFPQTLRCPKTTVLSCSLTLWVRNSDRKQRRWFISAFRGLTLSWEVSSNVCVWGGVGVLNSWRLESSGDFCTRIWCLRWGVSNVGLRWDSQLEKIHVALPVAGASSEHGDLRVVVLRTRQLGTARAGVPAAKGRCCMAFNGRASEVAEGYFPSPLSRQSQACPSARAGSIDVTPWWEKCSGICSHVLGLPYNSRCQMGFLSMWKAESPMGAS